MPEKLTVRQRLTKVVAEQLGVDISEVTEDAGFVKDLGADSLDEVELVMAVEEEFQVEIPDEDAEKITTVRQAMVFLHKKGIEDVSTNEAVTTQDWKPVHHQKHTAGLYAGRYVSFSVDLLKLADQVGLFAAFQAFQEEARELRKRNLDVVWINTDVERFFQESPQVVVSDDRLRTMWRNRGGRFHGPNIETGTMPEHQLLPFLRDLLNGSVQ